MSSSSIPVEQVNLVATNGSLAELTISGEHAPAGEQNDDGEQHEDG